MATNVSCYRFLMAIFACLLSWSMPAMAQQVLSTDRIFEQAHHAWDRNDPVRAYGFLTAYLQRDPPSLDDENFRREMLDWHRRAYVRAQSRTASSGNPGGSGSIGTTSQGVTVNYNPPASQPTGPRAYRLDCRGGGGMVANYRPVGRFHQLEIDFSKEAFASSTRQPTAGRCSWVDRPIGVSEPSSLVWRFDSGQRSVQSFRFGSATGNDQAALAENREAYTSGLVVGVRGKRLADLISAIHRGRPFAVECYNDRKGNFIVTRLISAR